MESGIKKKGADEAVLFLTVRSIDTGKKKYHNNHYACYKNPPRVKVYQQKVTASRISSSSRLRSVIRVVASNVNDLLVSSFYFDHSSKIASYIMVTF